MKRRPPKHNVRRVAHINHNMRGVTLSKNGETIQYESLQEFLLICLLERNPRVQAYRSQPLTIAFRDDDGKDHRYTVDFEVWLTDGSVEIHEVTVSGRRSTLSAIRREIAARDMCNRKGWKYVVHTELTLPRETESANLITLYGFRAPIYANPAVKRFVVGNITAMPINLAALAQEIASGLQLSIGDVTAALCHLIWREELLVDENKLLFIDAVFSSS